MNKSKILLLDLLVILLPISYGMELVSKVMGEKTFEDLDNMIFLKGIKNSIKMILSEKVIIIIIN